MRHVPLCVLVLVPATVAQQGTTTTPPGSPPLVNAAFSNFGSGCAGTGWATGADLFLPASLASSFGNVNNNIPLSWTPTRYQQVFLGSEIGTGVVVVGIGLRQDNQFSGYEGRQINLEVSLGGTTFDHTSLSTSFTGNFNSATAPRQVVFQQRNFCLPVMASSAPTNPADLLFTIPLDVPYPIALGANENLLVEMLNSGNSNGNASFTYPLDAGSGVTTARLWGAPAAATGTVGTGYGMVMALRTLGGTTPAIAHLFASTRPHLGQTFYFGISHGTIAAPTLVFVGSSNTSSGGIPLPLDLTPLGAAGCQLLVSINQIVLATATNAGGDLALALPIPSSTSLDGAPVYLQAFCFDPSVNALGFVASDGGMATLGT